MTDRSQRIIVVDPGKDGHIGVSEWRGPRETGRWLFSFYELVTWLETRTFDRVVYEGYILDHRAGRQVGSTLDASQVIGMVRSYAHRHDIKLVMQKNLVLKPAAMHAGVPIPTHFHDDVAAALHGFYYWERQGLAAREIQLLS